MAETPNLSSSQNKGVGYGNPPVETRFKKGQSGNPNGRPKGSKNKPPSSQRAQDILLKEAYRYVEIQEKAGPVSMPMMQAVIRSLGLKAAKGNVGAQKLLYQAVTSVEQVREQEKLKTYDKVMAYKKSARAEIAKLKAQGEPVPEYLPHPEDISVDPGTGDVYFHGPANEEDKKIWYQMHAQIEAIQDDLNMFKETKKEIVDDGGKDLDSINEQIEHQRYMLKCVALEIMRRWHLPAKKVVKEARYAFRKLLDQHLEQGTDPEPPATFELPVINWEAMDRMFDD